MVRSTCGPQKPYTESKIDKGVIEKEDRASIEAIEIPNAFSPLMKNI
ncbi:hypothetical protein FF011L_22460 [Roseimaritima multifibrata]|uniref:Uncharacterized protein n=1 Tax=Roseimaritima multifibrata TaxID=1930274 RepID=A0A517MF53_9BACT|nr:hypothetical protein FF011L_22460 [Roseimaritima multifibrata]